MAITIERTASVLLPMGTYPAIVADIEVTDGQYGAQLKFTFEILEGEYQGTKRVAWCSAVLSAKSKLNLWASAILGPDMPVDGSLDAEDMLNRKCQIELVTAAGKDGSEYNKVFGVKPWRTARPAPTVTRPSVKVTPPAQRGSAPATVDDGQIYVDDEEAATADTSASLF